MLPKGHPPLDHGAGDGLAHRSWEMTEEAPEELPGERFFCPPLCSLSSLEFIHFQSREVPHGGSVRWSISWESGNLNPLVGSPLSNVHFRPSQLQAGKSSLKPRVTPAPLDLPATVYSAQPVTPVPGISILRGTARTKLPLPGSWPLSFGLLGLFHLRQLPERAREAGPGSGDNSSSASLRPGGKGDSPTSEEAPPRRPSCSQELMWAWKPDVASGFLALRFGLNASCELPCESLKCL